MAEPTRRSARQGAARSALRLLLSSTLLACGCSRAAGPTIGLSPATDGPRLLIVNGLAEHLLDSFAELDAEKRQAMLHVSVADAPPGSPSLLGDVARRGAELVFTPRYPFQPGVNYRARFDPAVFGKTEPPLLAEFMLPAPPHDPVVRVAAIYPSSDELPENLLKFYIHFSGPMNRGDAYRHVRLLDDAGQTVAAPFLELGEELWNPEMTRFTLFFDPGRIKQGLVPRMELGPAMVSGKTYSLVIDKDWEDGEHRPLVESARKVFRAGPVKSVQPDPARWRITPPDAGSTQDLSIRFDEPLDHALLERVFTVRASGGRKIAGAVNISDQEQQWSFTPQAPWPAGRHVIAVETILEDTAGNSIGRPFEVDLNRGAAPVIPAIMEIPFDVSGRN